MSKVPLVDLQAQYAEISAEIDSAIQRVVTNADFILGHDVEAFEEEYADYCGSAHAVGLDSGISALELGMRALGIGPGDEVITPANSFIASSGAISFTGATPIWVDADPKAYNMDPARIEPLITDRTRAIMPVHLYGQPADMDPIMEIAESNGLAVIEDACQAHGARYKGRRVGTIGDVAAFSFYPGKNLGAYGDGGMLTTNRADIATTVRMMRNYGQRKKYEHAYLAWNRRLDSIQAAVLRVKLRHLDQWNECRRQHAAYYDRLLANSPLELPEIQPYAEHVFHIYAVQTTARDDLLALLHEEQIGAGIHYPVPIHLQEAYRERGGKVGDFPVTERLALREISLPMYSELRDVDIERIAEIIVSFVPS